LLRDEGLVVEPEKLFPEGLGGYYPGNGEDMSLLMF